MNFVLGGCCVHNVSERGQRLKETYNKWKKKLLKCLTIFYKMIPSLSYNEKKLLIQNKGTFEFNTHSHRLIKIIDICHH